MENDETGWLNSPSTMEISVGTDIEEAQDYNQELPAEFTENYDDLDEANVDDIGVLQEDALEYVAGYIIRKHNLEEFEHCRSSFSWVDQVSKGFLKKPSESFLEQLKKLEAIFFKMNGSEILHCHSLKENRVRRSQNVNLPEVVKNLFFKCRIFFRVRHLNKCLMVQKAKQRIMGFKKMIKINL